jgi:hypothetical protein
VRSGASLRSRVKASCGKRPQPMHAPSICELFCIDEPITKRIIINQTCMQTERMLCCCCMLCVLHDYLGLMSVSAPDSWSGTDLIGRTHSHCVLRGTETRLRETEPSCAFAELVTLNASRSQTLHYIVCIYILYVYSVSK